jgi:NitT/TauT family transport system substrate-binding protein
MRVTRLGWIMVLVVAGLAGGGYFLWNKKHERVNPLLPIVNTSDCKGILGRPLRVGIVTWPGYAGGIVANNGFRPNQGSIYYKKYNLCVEILLMEDVDARAKAFARGGKDGVDIVWSTVDFWANELPGFLKNDVKAKAIMQVDWSRGGDAIVADNSVKRIEDLYGKKISLALFTPSHWLLEYNLQNSSLEEAKQSEIVRSLVGKNASPDARADFVAGKVDAAVVWEPDVEEAIQKRPNSHVLVSSREARKLIADLMVAREDFIRDHPDVIQAFVEGWVVEGTQKANREPDTVTRLLMENEPLYKDLGPEVTKKNLATVKWADLADNTEMFNLDGKGPQPLFDQIFNQAGKSWVARGYITATVPPAVAKDDSFLRRIYQKNPVERIPDALPVPSAEVAKKEPLTQKPITVNYAVGSATLDAAAKKLIDEEVSLLPKTFSGTYIRVEGNTDNLGNASANRALSLRRAQAVIDYLVRQYQLPVNQFIAVGNGPDKPVASNASAAERSKNRRTDISVVSREVG